MNHIRTNLVMFMTLSVLVLTVANPQPSAIFFTAVTVLATSAVLGARYLAVLIVSFRLTVGSRAHRHREVLTRIVPPRHPNTPGRPRTRAPSQSEAAA